MVGSQVDIWAGTAYKPSDCIAVLAAPDKFAPALVQQCQKYNTTEFENFASGIDDVKPEELETFGLTLAGRKSGDRESFGGMLYGSLVEAASRADFNEFFSEVDGETVMPLSRLTVVPTQRFDDAKAPRFTFKEGETKGNAQLKVAWGEGVLGFTGVLEGTLYAENYKMPDGNPARIEVEASFVAAEGALGCDFGDTFNAK